MIEIEKLTKIYRANKKSIKALNSVNLLIRKGEVFTIVGPNGAGKTTLIKIISTLVLPTAGYVKVNGFDVVHDEFIVRKMIGLSTGYERSFYYRLTGAQNLFFFGGLYGIDSKTLKNRINYLMDKFNISNHKDVKYMKYSTGMKKKLSLARALLHNPEVCIFDEPLSSVDPESAQEIVESILRLKNDGKTILIASHNLGEIEKFSDRVAVMNNGKIIKVDTVTGLKKNLGVKIIEINDVYKRDIPVIKNCLKKFNISKFEMHNEKISFHINEVEYIPYIFASLKSIGISLSMVEVKNPGLEKVFIQMVKREKC